MRNHIARTLSLALSLMLAISAMVFPAFAEGNVASVDGAEYATLQEALNNADGKTVSLLADVTESVSVPAGATVTLDLNGHTLIGAASDAIFVPIDANLTVTTSNGGSVQAGAQSYAAILNNGTATLIGGHFTRATGKWYTIVNHGEMTINAGVTADAPNDNSSSLVENGYNSYDGSNPRNSHVDGVNSAVPTLTINGGVFTAVGCNAVKDDDGSVLYIHGGTFTCSGSQGAAVQNWGTATITGGTFIGTGAVAAVITTGVWGDHAPGKTTITGGDFSVQNAASNPPVFTSSYGSSSGGALNISGGTFSGPINPALMDKCYTTTITTGTFTDETAANYAAATSVAATLESTGLTYVGAPAEVNETLNDNAEEGDKVTIVAGSADLTGLEQVVVSNAGTGTVTVNDRAVGTDPITAHSSVEAIEAAAPTCTESGHIAHWHCDECDSYFLDEALTQAVSLDDLLIPAAGHKLTAVAAKAATEDAAGNTAYWHCTVCGKYFSDAEGKAEITLASTVLPATGKTPAQPAGGKQDGDKAPAAGSTTGTGTTTGTAAATSVKTGDSSALLWCIPAFAALAGAVCIVLLRKKRA